jgi:hypothetical protein
MNQIRELRLQKYSIPNLDILNTFRCIPRKSELNYRGSDFVFLGIEADSILTLER